MKKISMTFEHVKGNGVPDAEEEWCQAEFEIQMEYEPADRNYGADADGNRGISVSGYYYADDVAPEKCHECGHVFCEDEKQEYEKAMAQAVADYDEDPDGDYPEPEYDRYGD